MAKKRMPTDGTDNGAPTEDPRLRWDGKDVPEPEENEPGEETEAYVFRPGSRT